MISRFMGHFRQRDHFMSWTFETTFETKYYDVFEKVIITIFEVEQCKTLTSILTARLLDADVFNQF